MLRNYCYMTLSQIKKKIKKSFKKDRLFAQQKSDKQNFGLLCRRVEVFTDSYNFFSRQKYSGKFANFDADGFP